QEGAEMDCHHQRDQVDGLVEELAGNGVEIEAQPVGEKPRHRDHQRIVNEDLPPVAQPAEELRTPGRCLAHDVTDGLAAQRSRRVIHTAGATSSKAAATDAASALVRPKARSDASDASTTSIAMTVPTIPRWENPSACAR